MGRTIHNWVKTGGWLHTFGSEIAPSLDIEAHNSGEMRFEVECSDCDYSTGNTLDLDEQRMLLRILIDNLEKNREALGGCPFAGIKFDAPCPLCGPAAKAAHKQVA